MNHHITTIRYLITSSNGVFLFYKIIKNNYRKLLFTIMFIVTFVVFSIQGFCNP
ncbi:hypothetical protein HanIR_Chr05g0223851 [Helianthus annuus]|nr:hypothetical protein HanIR_Chr05g0223851 [Helianthus annuus]